MTLDDRLEEPVEIGRGWVIDQLDGTSFIKDALDGIEEVKATAKLAILSDLLQIIGEDAPEYVWKGADEYLYNKLRQELRNIIGVTHEES